MRFQTYSRAKRRNKIQDRVVLGAIRVGLSFLYGGPQVFAVA